MCRKLRISASRSKSCLQEYGNRGSPAPLWLPSHNPAPSSSSSAVSGCPTLVCHSANPYFLVSLEIGIRRILFHHLHVPGAAIPQSIIPTFPNPAELSQLLSELLQITTKLRENLVLSLWGRKQSVGLHKSPRGMGPGHKTSPGKVAKIPPGWAAAPLAGGFRPCKDNSPFSKVTGKFLCHIFLLFFPQKPKEGIPKRCSLFQAVTRGQKSQQKPSLLLKNPKLSMEITNSAI